MVPAFEHLLEKFLADELTPVELQFFLIEVKDPSNLAKLQAVLAEKLEQRAYAGFPEDPKIDQLFQQMLQKAEQYNTSIGAPVGGDRSGKLILFRRMAATVALLLILSGGVFLWLHHTAPAKIVAKAAPPVQKNDVEPGGDKAILTLSDGTKITLDAAGNGAVAQQGATKVIKLASGQLVYRVGGQNSNEISYNTMSTPRGGQYRITLPDGTQVWLNASSSITYPTAFVGKERKVVLTGEAYFEVAPAAAMPFRVMTKEMEVDVCGTHFDVNAYSDELSTSATLLEGAVKVSPAGHPAILVKPGQQAILPAGGKLSLIDEADVEEAIAWKEGLFSFNGAGLPAIMRQLARWYDLDVQYEGTIPKRRFTGKVFRNLRLSEVLKVLELNHIHFRLTGNSLTVTP